ncbi:MAG: site-2 protease family protein [bacterium]|nr:site-2 protease family protein [bacterium]
MNILTFLIGFAILIYSIILHEIAHGYVADRLGDPTARMRGRLTLNPIPHIDLLMSIVLPFLLIFTSSPVVFGAAKPVPIDPFNFRDPRKDMGITGLAGPLTNILIAVFFTLIFRFVLPFFPNPTLSAMIISTIALNLGLAALNLIPIPPLDGSRILAAILPKEFASLLDSLEQYGLFILFFLLVFPIGGFSLSRFIFSLVSLWLKWLGF